MIKLITVLHSESSEHEHIWSTWHVVEERAFNDIGVHSETCI